MIALLLCGCDPYASWPDEDLVFPAVYTPLEGLPDWASVRVETETWSPGEDLVETAFYVQKAAYLLPDAPPETLEHFGRMRSQLPPLVARDPVVTFTGDLMMVEGEAQGVASGVAGRMRGLRVSNLETPVAPSFPTTRDGLVEDWGFYAFNMPPALLVDLPVDVLQLNNNHSNDLGAEGIRETEAQVAAHGYEGVGGPGGNAVAVEHGGQSLTFLSYTWGLNRYDPSPGADLAIVPFGHLDEPIDLSRVRREATRARRDGADQVVVLVHWGYEYELYPDPHFLTLGRRLVEAGADLVVGTGPHVVQPAEWCRVNRPASRPGIGACAVRTDDGVPRDAAILYSLGDFVTSLQTPALATGVLVSVSFAPGGGVSGLAWDPVVSDHSGADTRTVPLSERAAEDEALAAEAERLDGHLGPGWKR